MFPTYCTFLVYILVQHHMGRPKKTGHPEAPKFQGQIPISEQTISIAISDC